MHFSCYPGQFYITWLFVFKKQLNGLWISGSQRRTPLPLFHQLGSLVWCEQKKYSSSNIYWEHTLCQALCQALWDMQICLRNSSSICRIYSLVMCELISQISLLLNFQMLPVTVINMCSQFPRNILRVALSCFLKRAQQVSITQTFNTCFALLWGTGRCQPPTWEAALPRMRQKCICCWQRHLLAAGRSSH